MEHDEVQEIIQHRQAKCIQIFNKEISHQLQIYYNQHKANTQ